SCISSKFACSVLSWDSALSYSAVSLGGRSQVFFPVPAYTTCVQSLVFHLSSFSCTSFIKASISLIRCFCSLILSCSSAADRGFRSLDSPVGCDKFLSFFWSLVAVDGVEDHDFMSSSVSMYRGLDCPPELFFCCCWRATSPSDCAPHNQAFEHIISVIAKKGKYSRMTHGVYSGNSRSINRKLCLPDYFRDSKSRHFVMTRQFPLLVHFECPFKAGL